MASVTSGYFVAVKDEGIFHFSAEEGWKRLFRVKSRIHVLTYIGPYIFAAGEKGAVLRILLFTRNSLFQPSSAEK